MPLGFRSWTNRHKSLESAFNAAFADSQQHDRDFAGTLFADWAMQSLCAQEAVDSECREPAGLTGRERGSRMFVLRDPNRTAEPACNPDQQSPRELTKLDHLHGGPRPSGWVSRFSPNKCEETGNE